VEALDAGAFHRIVSEAQGLIASGRASEAIELLERCSGPTSLVTQLRAVVFSSIREDREALLRGVEAWRRLTPDDSPDVAFQLASALQAVVDLTVRDADKVVAIERDRDHVREARLRYLAAAANEDASKQVRLVSLVNCGNLFSSFGREVDALDCYDRALRIDSAFGMALGNRAMALARVAPFMDAHQSHVLEEAAWLLERAFEDEQRIRDVGGSAAFETLGLSDEVCVVVVIEPRAGVWPAAMGAPEGRASWPAGRAVRERNHHDEHDEVQAAPRVGR
jgi:tetratricopeptide (TPR) repeat protein